jgi:hypothetical protein
MSQHPSTRLSQVATRSSWAEPWSKLYPFQGSGGRSKYEFVKGKDDIPYMKRKIKLMYQTSNQKSLPFVYNLGTQRDFALPHYWRVTTKILLPAKIG